MKLMQKIMLSCKQATFFSSIKSFRELKLVNKIQLKLHLMMCKNCAEFDKQSQIIDNSLHDFHSNKQLLSKESLSSEKIQGIKSTVNTSNTKKK